MSEQNDVLQFRPRQNPIVAECEAVTAAAHAMVVATSSLFALVAVMYARLAIVAVPDLPPRYDPPEGA